MNTADNLTFQEYKEAYIGSATEEFFNSELPVAQGFLSVNTLGRSRRVQGESLTEKIQEALALYVTLSYNYDQKNSAILEQMSKGIKSESVLSHSVTYESNSSQEYMKNKVKEVGREVRRFLFDTGLLNTSVKLV